VIQIEKNHGQIESKGAVDRSEGKEAMEPWRFSFSNTGVP